MDEIDPIQWQPLLDLNLVQAWGRGGVRALRMLAVELGRQYESRADCDAKRVSHLGEAVANGQMTFEHAWELCDLFPGHWLVANLVLVLEEQLARCVRKHVWLSERPFVPERVHETIRCIVGNPFRPVAFDPAWRTEHTVGIASKMYDDRDFAAMPILADALEEAGCDSADLLSHCREPGPHARGCWVVDGVLGKR